MQTQYFLTTDWYLLFLLYAQIIRNTGSRVEENVQTLHISELLSVVLKLIKYVWVCFFLSGFQSPANWAETLTNHV